MQGLFLADWNAFIRWHKIGSGHKKVIYLPGLSTNCVTNFIEIASSDNVADYERIMIDYIGSGFEI